MVFVANFIEVSGAAHFIRHETALELGSPSAYGKVIVIGQR